MVGQDLILPKKLVVLSSFHSMWPPDSMDFHRILGFHLVNTLVMQWTHWKQHRVWTKIKARAKQIQERFTKDLDRSFPGFSFREDHIKEALFAYLRFHTQAKASECTTSQRGSLKPLDTLGNHLAIIVGIASLHPHYDSLITAHLVVKIRVFLGRKVTSQFFGTSIPMLCYCISNFSCWSPTCWWLDKSQFFAGAISKCLMIK